MFNYSAGPILTSASYWHIDWTSQHSSGFKKAEEDADKEAQEKLKEIKASGQKQGDKVVDGLIKSTTIVKPEVPEKMAKA